VRWARLPGHGHTVAEACKKFGLTLYAYRKAARELREEARLHGDDELILAGLHPYPSGATVQNLIFYYAWINHAGITPKQVRAILRRLIKQGMVKHVSGDHYRLAREWP
jgi:hypothetical protein